MNGAGGYDSFDVRCTRSGVVDARERVVDTARSWGADVDFDALRLTTSETITNALRHGDGPIRVIVDWRDDRVRVEVEDRHPVRPTRRDAEPFADGGRGLQLVSTVARRWGTLVAGPVKTVWFELPTGASRSSSI